MKFVVIPFSPNVELLQRKVQHAMFSDSLVFNRMSIQNYLNSQRSHLTASV